MSEQRSLNIEGLARIDLRPDEILAITLAGLDPDHTNMAQISEDITEWLAAHGQPVAGVMVLPQGSQLAAIRAPEPATVNIDLSGTVMTDKHMKQFIAEFMKRRPNPPEQGR